MLRGYDTKLECCNKKKKSNIDLMKKKNRYLIKQTKANPTQTPA